MGETKPQIIVDNPPIISPENPKVGEDVEVTYTLRPQPFQHNISKPKEIVLVLDRSGSMREKLRCEHGYTHSHWYNGQICNPSGETKIQALKDAAKKFIQDFSNEENLKIGIVSYEYEATIDSPLLDVKTNNKNLQDIIDRISPDGGTNPGDGIRKAGYLLKNSGDESSNKTIVFMSDGLPTGYTTYSRSHNYYLPLDNETPRVRGSEYYGKDYALEIGDIIKNKFKNSNIFTIGYGLDRDGNSTMRDIHESMGGMSENFYESSNNIGDIFNKISDDIKKQYKIEDQKLDLNLDSSVQLVSDIKYGDIVYTRQEDGWYTANPVQIKFKMRCNKKGTIDIVKEGSSFKYKDIFGNEVNVDIPPLSIHIGTNSKVTIKVRDSSGVIDNTYDSSDNVGKRYDKIIKNAFDQDYKLFGESYADIKFEGDEINYLQYQFIKSNEKPNTLPVDGWKEIYDESGGVPADVDLSKEGYLTQKSYNVSHMPSVGNSINAANREWKNKNKVYQYPFSETEYKPATIANNAHDYVEKVKYIDENGIERTKWVPKTIFTNQGNLGNEYKEANKSWGYMKVKESGTYTIKVTADDGFYGTITTEGKKVNEFSPDIFSLHGPEPSEVTVNLEAGKYYPIYLEYFNWGGGLQYTIQYKKGNGRYENIPTDCFYPSKNKTPGESGENIFTGETGVKFPDEPGKYYIAYKAGIKPNNIKEFNPFKEGVYGPFVIDQRFTLSRSIVENNIANTPYDYTLKYTLKPNDIRITDIYKNEKDLLGHIKENLEIKNMKLKDIIPNGLQIANNYMQQGSSKEYIYSINGNSISGNIIGDLNYTLDRNQDLKSSIYKADPIVISIGITSEEAGKFIFKDNTGVFMYKDVSLNDTGSNKEQNFGETSFTIQGRNEVKSHGLYSESGGKFKIGTSDQEVVKGMYYTIGIDVDVKRNNSKLILKPDIEGIIDFDSIEIYKYESDNRITEVVNGYSKIKNGNSIDITRLNKGTYIVTYVAKFDKSSSIDAKSDKSNKVFNASIIKSNDGSGQEDYLPELF
jgi:hypothetical protein